MARESTIRANDIHFRYNDDMIILDGVGLEIGRREILGILGPNGSGKTTFLKCLNRILEPFQGEIVLHDRDVKEYSRKELALSIGLVPQSSTNEMAAPMVYDVVMMGRKPHIKWQTSKKDEDIVWNVMEELDVADLAAKPFDELSSGQTQRVLIARAIAQDAEVLLLDEPTSNLDVKYQMEVMSLIRDLVDNKGVCACAIIHDLDLAMKYCDKIVLLHDGHVVSAGTPVEALTPECIHEVYGVRAFVENIHGRFRVMMERFTSL